MSSNSEVQRSSNSVTKTLKLLKVWLFKVRGFEGLIKQRSANGEAPSTRGERRKAVTTSAPNFHPGGHSPTKREDRQGLTNQTANCSLAEPGEELRR